MADTTIDLNFSIENMLIIALLRVTCTVTGRMAHQKWQQSKLADNPKGHEYLNNWARTCVVDFVVRPEVAAVLTPVKIRGYSPQVSA